MQPADLLPSELARFEEVCRFGQDRLEPLAQTIAAAFADDPIWKWIYHGGDRALPVDEALVMARWLCAAMSPVDEIHGFRHHDAVALWHAPITPETEPVLAAHHEGLPSFGAALGPLIGDRLEAIGVLGEAMARARPAEPHWYLGILATHPIRQSQGLGGRVLQAMHRRSDRLGVPCYLESSNPANYAFYLRHGYVETGSFTAGDSPPLMGFRRGPR